VTRGLASHDETACAEALRRSKEQFRGLVAAAGGLLWVTDGRGQVAEDLPAWRAFTGQSREQISGDGWIAALHPEDRAHSAAFWAAAIETGEPCETQFRLRRHDGEYRSVDLRAVPIADGDGTTREWIGLIVDITERKGAEQELARLRVRLAALAVANEEHERQGAVIDELNATLHACHALAEAYPLIRIAAIRLFPTMNGGLALSDRTSQLETVASWGSKTQMAPVFALDDCWGLRRGELHIVEASQQGAACVHFTSPVEGTSLCLPLVVHGESLGLLHLDGGPGIDREQRRLIIRFANVLKIALADLKLREHLRLLAIRDPLTGLFNRQYLEETLPRECQFARRRKSPLSLAMLDIDHFKQFNDSYGHEAGDEVLRELGRLLRTAVRSSDIACRYGGEEFVLVLLDADRGMAAARLEQICRDIKARQCIYRGRILPSIAVSAGVAEFPVNGRSPEEILRAADQALYAAKHAGRDRIALSKGPPADIDTDPKSSNSGRSRRLLSQPLDT
jgi:diguanylate cyclase (GGDEF)-like protein/PAS domain S-box-containing protein